MWVLYKDISWENDLLPALKKVKWPWVYASFVFGYIATLLRGLRWNIMLEPMGYKVRDWWAVHAVAFGYCMNNLIPRSGELARCTLLNRTDHVPVNKLIGTVLLERIVDIVLMATLIFLAFVLEQEAFHSISNHRIHGVSLPSPPFRTYSLFQKGSRVYAGDDGRSEEHFPIETQRSILALFAWHLGFLVVYDLHLASRT